MRRKAKIPTAKGKDPGPLGRLVSGGMSAEADEWIDRLTPEGRE